MNFTKGIPEDAVQDLQQDDDAFDAAEESQSAEIAARGHMMEASAVTFMTSVIVEFHYWASLF